MANNPSASSLTGKLQIEVFGVDLDGHPFIEQTRTLTITRDGATIPLANKLAPESELIIRNPVTNQEAVARVVDLIEDATFVLLYGIAFSDPSVNLWHVEIPEAESKNAIIMECSRCHAVEAVLLSDIEMEIIESKQALTRRCECSNSSTIWRQTDRNATGRTATKHGVSDRQQKISPVEEPASRAPQERRKEKRKAMKTAACIRCSAVEEVVECEDVSRGGFRFKSRKAYPTGMLIEAAVPYAKSNVDIFLTSRIAFQQELSGGFYRHGVAYVESSKSLSSKS